ncbi:MAG: helix-turn-helix transcriptional regulator [Cyanobacteriota bacterium]|nr:helix-turn-helix transcriptional regulator [Cyanobacteriota bacterium]MDY6359322.1 helix-turn-helix transcriptional regulator [Cyanobacteriota bacterium]MDY6364588.1 helix-turn-helix transcriptional regulator [Cyanobacteriota bacterium]
MTLLNKEKMREIKEASGLSYQEIADQCGISISAVSKIFGGFRANPSVALLAKIAKVLNCEVDDFLVREEEPTSSYYIDKITAQLAQDLTEKPELNAALKAMRDLSPNDIKFVQEFAERLKKQ